MSADYPLVSVYPRRTKSIFVILDAELNSIYLTPAEALLLVERLKEAYDQLRRGKSSVEEPG